MRQRYSPRFEQNFGGFRGIHTRPNMSSGETALFPKVWKQLFFGFRCIHTRPNMLSDLTALIQRFEQNFGGFRGIHTRPNMLSDETALFPKVWTELWWIQRYTYPTEHVVRWDSVIPQGLNRTLVDSEVYIPDRTCCQMRQRYSPRFEQNFGGFRGIHTRPDMLSDETALFPKVWTELWWIQRYTYPTEHVRWDSVIPRGLNRTLVDSEVYIPDRTCCQMRQRYSPRFEQNFGGLRGIHTRPNMLSDETALFPKVWTELWWIQRYTYPTDHVVRRDSVIPKVWTELWWIQRYTYPTEHVVRWDSVIPQGLNRTLVDSEVYIPDRTCCQMRQRYSPRFEQNFGGFRGIHTRPNMLSDETALFPKVWTELLWIQRYTYPTEHVVRWDSVIPQGLNRALVDSEVYIPDRTCCQMRQRYSPRFENSFGGFRGIHTRPNMLSDETALFPKVWTELWWIQRYTYPTEHVVRWDSVIPQGLNWTFVDSEVYIPDRTCCQMRQRYSPRFEQNFGGFRGIHTRPNMLSDETALFPKVWTKLWWIQRYTYPTEHVVRWDSVIPKVWTELWWIQRYTLPDRTCCQMRQHKSPRFEENFCGLRGIHTRPNMLSDGTALYPKIWPEHW